MYDHIHGTASTADHLDSRPKHGASNIVSLRQTNNKLFDAPLTPYIAVLIYNKKIVGKRSRRPKAGCIGSTALPVKYEMQ